MMVDATGLNKGDVIRAWQNIILTVERVYRKEAKPVRIKFRGHRMQTVKPGRMVELLQSEETV